METEHVSFDGGRCPRQEGVSYITIEESIKEGISRDQVGHTQRNSLLPSEQNGEVEARKEKECNEMGTMQNPEEDNAELVTEPAVNEELPISKET